MKMDSSEDEDEILFELPNPPRLLLKPQADWGAMSTSSTRFAVAALRKSTKASLFKCKRLISTSKEGERLEAELDRVSRQTKNDMALAKVPKALLKDRRIAALEDVSRTLAQMNKKLKVSFFMESYLNDVQGERKKMVNELEARLDTAKIEAASLEGPLYPTVFEIATRANRACPPSFARTRANFPHDNPQNNASSVFLFNCRTLSD